MIASSAICTAYESAVRHVSRVAVVGSLSACSLYQYSQITPARSDSLDCARTMVQDLGYEIVSDDEDDGVIKAVRVFRGGNTNTMFETQEFLSVQERSQGGRPILRIAVGAGHLTAERVGDPEPAISQAYGRPTDQAIADVEKLLKSCGDALGR